jgi:hypothetical protein
MPEPTKEKPVRSWWPARQISGRAMSIPCSSQAVPPTVISATRWSGSLRPSALTSIAGQPSAAGTTSVNYRKPACRRYHCAETDSIISTPITRHARQGRPKAARPSGRSVVGLQLSCRGIGRGFQEPRTNGKIAHAASVHRDELRNRLGRCRFFTVKEVPSEGIFFVGGF